MRFEESPLGKRLVKLLLKGARSSDDLLLGFLEYAEERGLALYPAQEEAILELLSHNHVILNTPTGSGKSLVAQAMHFLARAEGRRSFYTAPTKALCNEKFFELCEAFSPEAVGLMTGDGAVNRDAPILCCTAEILGNIALRSDDAPVDYAVIDEFHYYGDRERGVAWQIPLITLKKTQFLLMSATLGETRDIERRLEEFSGRRVAVVRGLTRPVPLEFEYRETPLHETIEDLLLKDRAPIYLVNFTQRDCAEQAQNLTSINVCPKETKRAIAEQLQGVRLDTPYGKEFGRFLRAGIGVHHAGLLPRYRRIVERLAQEGLVRVISGTDTLGVGVNIPIRTVVLRQLYKFDGEKTIRLPAREFHQIAGRAGRKGFDERGYIVVQAPEWVIENQRIEAKIGAQPHLKKKLQKQRPPPNALPWDRAFFEKLREAPPEPLAPQFDVSHGMIIHLLQAEAEATDARAQSGMRRLFELIGRAHGSAAQKKAWRKRAAALFRALVGAEIVRIERSDGRARARVEPGLQADFSLNHSLSLFLVEVHQALDPAALTHALDLLSLVEAILDDPKVILLAQLHKRKGELVAQLKAEGVPYEERMEKLELLEHPKPLADFLYTTFNLFQKAHPWVGSENIRPKSIAREMFERCQGFADYVRDYGLERSEGVLLRHLSQTYRAAVQNVPEASRTEAFEDILAFLLNLVRRTDASLLEEWQLLLTGERPAAAEPGAAPPPDPFADRKALRLRVRNEMLALLRALRARDYEAAVLELHQSEENSWTRDALERAMAAFWECHSAIDLTPQAREMRRTHFAEEAPRVFDVRQSIVDPAGQDDWTLYCAVDLTRPRDPSSPLIELRRIEP